MASAKLTAFLSEIEHAAQSTFEATYRDHGLLAKAEEKLKALTAETVRGYERVNFLNMNPDLDDDGMEATASYFDTYFGADKDRHSEESKARDLATRIAAHQVSVATLSASVLQMAKQTLAIRFGGPKNVPGGRLVLGVEIRDVIWQGRNQGIHWDEGKFTPAVEQVFQALAKADDAFADYKTRSMAFEILRILGWKEFKDMERDLLQLDT